MPSGDIEPVLPAELGPDWRQSFHAFDGRPVAAAAIGQVHRGVWHDGRDVAVKVQYDHDGVRRLEGALVAGLDGRGDRFDVGGEVGRHRLGVLRPGERCELELLGRVRSAPPSVRLAALSRSLPK